ncbi:Outer membrane translocation and assembly module TamA [Thermoflexibacter ruber]|uniref:Outer membrane translocation and assembly module TamA n=2 Tax=Thermoflexibacter ruber TaxID=1003 RepID=A0A1I2F5F4_9BACT|nr:Outer membrane translocation and assembly module TamA [Thermoflexibacter ruber]
MSMNEQCIDYCGIFHTMIKSRLSNFLWSCIVVLFIANCSYAQRYTLKIHTPEQAILSKLSYNTTFQDSLSVYKTLNLLIAELYKQSYLTASFDTVFFVERQAHALLSIGKKYAIIHLQKGNIEDFVIEKAGLRKDFLHNQNIDFQYFISLQEKILTYWENHGYPFAQVKLDSIRLIDNQIFANIDCEKGTYIRFDTLLIEGEGKVKGDFLRNYLKIKQNEPFSQQKVKEAERLLKALPYLKLKKPLEVVFEYDRAFILITLDKIKSSQFDGIVGVLPNQEQKNRVLVTGQVNLNLANLFSTGKKLHLEWQRLRSASQLFNFEYEHPQFLKMNFDINAKLNLLKEDTSFLNIRRNIQFSYQLTPQQKVSFFTDYQTTSVTDGSTNQAAVGQESQRFIRFANTNLLSYGISYELNTLNDFLKPQKGWYIKGQVGTGNKKISPRLGSNPAVDTIFRNIDLNSTQWTLSLSMQKFFYTGKNTSLMLKTVGGAILNNQLFMNELYRLGGLNSIRGFNQNAFYASHYLVNTAEARLYFEETSYLFAFLDYAYLSYQIPTQSFQDAPLGVGAGISFATKGGVFNFAYAMGVSQFQQFAVNQAKVHFGYVSRF